MLNFLKKYGYSLFFFTITSVLIGITLFAPPAAVISGVIMLATTPAFSYLGTLCISYALVTILLAEAMIIAVAAILLKQLAKCISSACRKSLPEKKEDSNSNATDTKPAIKPKRLPGNPIHSSSLFAPSKTNTNETNPNDDRSYQTLCG